MARYSEKICFALAFCHLLTVYIASFYIYGPFLALYAICGVYGAVNEGLRIHVMLQHLGAMT